MLHERENDNNLNLDQDPSKREKIFQACRNKDISQLRELAISNGGLVDDEVRRVACRYTGLV